MPLTWLQGKLELKKIVEYKKVILQILKNQLITCQFRNIIVNMTLELQELI